MLRVIKKRQFLAVLGLVVMTGCYYDKADLVYPADTTPCDTTAVKYSTDVVSILSANCYVCHAAAVAASVGGGIILDNYTGASAQAKNGQLVKAIEHKPGASAMPKNAAQLSSCDIARIRTWVNNGYPNN
jgi:mono/diheme cytochrome c family protein